MTNTFIGIDPGKTGGIAIITPDNSAVYDLPYVDKRLDSNSFYLILGTRRGKTIAVIEQQQFRPDDGKNRIATTFENFGRLCGIVELLGADRILLPTPGKWKKAMGLTGKDKEASRAMAMHLFGDLQDELKRKKDHGRAEALLLAEYGRKQVK